MAGRRSRTPRRGTSQAVRDLVIDVLTPEQLRVLAEAGEAVGARLTSVNCRAAESELADDDRPTSPDEGEHVSTSS